MAPSTFTARDAQRQFGYLLETAITVPVTIEKHGRPVAVMMSVREFSRLQEMEDAYWGQLADRAGKKGEWLHEKDSVDLLLKLSRASD